MIAGLSASFLQCDHLENVTVDARTVSQNSSVNHLYKGLPRQRDVIIRYDAIVICLML